MNKQNRPVNAYRPVFKCIPLGQGGAASLTKLSLLLMKSLNPFEVREVLQAVRMQCRHDGLGLNPFEVREVLQACS